MAGMEPPLILAADIGGTRARFIIGRVREGICDVLRHEVLLCAAYPGVEALIEAFLGTGQSAEKPDVVCLAVAGALEDQCISMTNLPWKADAECLRNRFGFSRVRLINDFAAQAYGLGSLDEDGIVVLHSGEPDAQGARALLGPGTGLGMVVLSGSLDRPQVFPSQGGLADFAPRNARELALCKSLFAAHGRVSLEMLLSGRGIERLYRFISGLPPEAPRSREAASISTAALAGEAVAVETLRFFAKLLAAATANLGLTVLAHGGIYLTGGIVPHILPFLREPEAAEAFRDHPSMGKVLARIPLYAVRDELLGLKGALRIAERLVHDEG